MFWRKNYGVDSREVFVIVRNHSIGSWVSLFLSAIRWYSFMRLRSWGFQFSLVFGLSRFISVKISWYFLLSVLSLFSLEKKKTGLLCLFFKTLRIGEECCGICDPFYDGFNIVLQAVLCGQLKSFTYLEMYFIFVLRNVCVYMLMDSCLFLRCWCCFLHSGKCQDEASSVAIWIKVIQNLAGRK